MMITPKEVTDLFIIVWIALAIVYDVVIIWLYGTEVSISWTIHQLAMGNPVAAFAMGILCGHFFWSQGGSINALIQK